MSSLRWTLVAAVAMLGRLAGSIEIDNGLVEEPEVECGADRVELQIRTRKPFRGKVYVKGHYNNPDCRMDYSAEGVGQRPTAGLIVRHGACDMARQRMIQPQGLQFGAVVVVSFHPTFITKVDRAFHLKCMYRETTKTVGAKVEVSPLTTELLTHNMPMPTCTYTIRADEIDGEILKYAKVGQQVVHRWECFSDVYGILVHSCYITDGQGEKVSIVDEKGCHVDRFLLGDPTYTESLSMAYRESHVFKFADRVAVRFQCQIRLCVKEDGGCSGITPPLCGRNVQASADRRRVPVQAIPITERRAEVTGVRPAPLLNSIAVTDISTTTTESNSNSSRQLDAVPSIQQRRTEAMERVAQALPSAASIFRRRVYRSARSLSPMSLDGDFASQTIYVLDSTEQPVVDSHKDGLGREAKQLRRLLGGGAIVGEMRGAGSSVCLGTGSFALMLGSVVLVFGASTVLAGLLLLRRLRRGRQGSKSLSSNASTASYASWAALFQ